MGATLPIWTREDRERTNGYLEEFGLKLTLDDACHYDEATGECCPGWFFDDEANRATVCAQCASRVKRLDGGKPLREDVRDGWTDNNAHEVWLMELRRLLALWRGSGSLSGVSLRKLNTMGRLVEVEDE
jgi:hypothetical protein